MNSKLIRFGSFSILLLLIFLGSVRAATPPSQREAQQTQLIWAIRSNDFKTVQKLLLEGLNPNYENEKNVSTTPLVEAIAEGQPKTIALLLDHGADVNFGTKDNIVPLCVATWYNDSDTVKLLIQRGANLEARDHEGYTPLLEAASHAQGLEVIKLLIAAGANVKAKTSEESETVLMLAAWNLNIDAIRLFIALGIDPCAKSKEGETAIDEVNAGFVKPELRKQVLELLISKCGS